MKNELENLLQKQMDRKSFIKHVGVGVAALTGLATIVKTMNGVSFTAKPQRVVGYGSSGYGGDKQAAR